MLSGEINITTIPFLVLQDKIFFALQLMNDNQITHLPVVDEEQKYVGLVSEDLLMDIENGDEEVGSYRESLGRIAVKSDEHFLKAIKQAAENGISLVPVIDKENNFLGSVAYTDLLRYVADFMSLNDPGGLIVFEVDSNQYSFNEISKMVESNNAQITQLNTSNNLDTGVMTVTIRVNKAEIADIVATFQRYEYTVKYYFGEELYTNELRSNYDNLMNYLQI